MRAAKSLATRYNPTVGAIRSWGARNNTQHFKVIIDNLMNLRLLSGPVLTGANEPGNTWLPGMH